MQEVAKKAKEEEQALKRRLLQYVTQAATTQCAVLLVPAHITSHAPYHFFRFLFPVFGRKKKEREDEVARKRREHALKRLHHDK